MRFFGSNYVVSMHIYPKNSQNPKGRIFKIRESPMGAIVALMDFCLAADIFSKKELLKYLFSRKHVKVEDVKGITANGREIIKGVS